MEIREPVEGEAELLLDIWLRSVRATHTFLTEDDIQVYLPYFRENALEELELWVVTSDDGTVMGFMGLESEKLESLFIAPEYLRRGAGRQLVEYARRLKGPLLVDVNEQNLAARKFYETLGFVVFGRSKLDSAGRPFPLLHMQDP